MTPAEQQLIEDLFARMQRLGRVDKDPDAERLINDAVRQVPDAAYLLVQSVLVQEDALQKADARIRQLEAQSAAEPARSFLGGSPLSRGSVPETGSRSATPAIPPPAAQPMPAEPERGGGFLVSALTTAASVAGGMLVADGIRGLFGGHGGIGWPSTEHGALDKAREQVQEARHQADDAHKELAADDAAIGDLQDQVDDGDAGWDSDNAIDA